MQDWTAYQPYRIALGTAHVPSQPGTVGYNVPYIISPTPSPLFSFHPKFVQHSAVTKSSVDCKVRTVCLKRGDRF
jgi:hypothetical protein